MTTDPATGETVYMIAGATGDLAGRRFARIGDIDLEVAQTSRKCFRIRGNDPLSARAETDDTSVFRRDLWSARVTTRTALSASKHSFRLTAELEAYEGDELVHSRQWNRLVPRDLV